MFSLHDSNIYLGVNKVYIYNTSKQSVIVGIALDKTYNLGGINKGKRKEKKKIVKVKNWFRSDVIVW